MAGIALVCIGRRKTGKTTFSKENLDNRPANMNVLIYDINNEYKDYYNEPFVDFEIFLEKIVNVKGTYILIEEATIFFDTSSRFEEMKNVLVRARHTQNIIQLNFHSWLSVPKNIFNLLDYVAVFKTNDSLMTVKSKYDNTDILAAYTESLKSENPYFKKVVSLY